MKKEKIAKGIFTFWFLFFTVLIFIGTVGVQKGILLLPFIIVFFLSFGWAWKNLPDEDNYFIRLSNYYDEE